MTQFSQGHVAILPLTTTSPRHLPSKQETSEGDSSVQTKELASPAPSPAKVKDRSRDQLLKLPESSARKLKQFDIKYNESKKKVADLVAGSQKLEEENARLQAALDGGGAEATAAAASVAQRSLEEKDDAIRVPSYELTGLQHEHEEKLRAQRGLSAPSYSEAHFALCDTWSRTASVDSRAGAAAADADADAPKTGCFVSFLAPRSRRLSVAG